MGVPENIVIRKATAEDAAPIAGFILLAMRDIVFELTDSTDYDRAREFMLHFTSRTGNQYGYENCWVAEIRGTVAGAACAYNGANLHALRAPVIRFVKEQYGKDLVLEDETQAGEYYLDSLGVDPAWQGHGIATRLLQFLIDEFVVTKNIPLGLLVDEDNPEAKRLYVKTGFDVINKKTFAGKKMEHLQRRPNSGTAR